MQEETKDFSKRIMKPVIGVIAAAAFAFGTCNYVLKPINDYRDSLYHQVRKLADRSELHPDYGNNDGSFDSMELEGVFKDLGVEPDSFFTFTKQHGLSLRNLKDYIKKYQPYVKK
ncbi:MAG: hypothetical protein V1648_01560 [Candidatus Aenigmatarchaeota archaeon]